MKNSILKNRITASLLAMICTLLWGTAFPFIKLGYAEFSIDSGDTGAKLLFAGLRFSLAGLMVLLFDCVKERRIIPIKKYDAVPVISLGFVLTFAQYLFTYIGIGFTSGTNTSIITACASFLTVLFVPIFFRDDKLTAQKLIGCAIGFGGVLVMNQGGGVSAETLPGDLLIFASTVCAAAGNILSKKFVQGRSPVALTGAQLLFGGALLCTAGITLGGRLDLSNTGGALILIWLAFVSASAFSLWTALLKYNPASKISVFNLFVPVFGTLLSGILLGEDSFKPATFISLGLIAIGIILVNLSKVGEKND